MNLQVPRSVAGRPEDASRPDPARDEVVIEVRDAAVRRGHRTIWRDVSLDVHAGEFMAILGPNGAGKSTLLKAILGVVPLSAGRITVLGGPPQSGKRRAGYVPQRRSFDADVHIRGVDLVALGAGGARWGVPLPGLSRLLGPTSRPAREQARVQEVIELVGAEEYARRPIGELSGGEQQRLLIAQALVTSPRILLLDEPLDSLDLHNQQEVSAVIRRVSEDCGATVLLVAHDINPIMPYLDRVCYVAAGRAVVGAPDQVITSETLSALYDSAVDVLCTRDGRLVVVGAPEGVSHHVPHDHHRH